MSGLIREAQNYILMNATAAIDFKRLAGTLGLGYTTFRHRFKKGLPRTICAGPRAALMVHGVKSTRSFRNRRGAVAVAVSRSVTVSRPSPSGTVW